jgi:hypothetical protein
MDQFLLILLYTIFVIYWVIMLIDCFRLKSLSRKLKISWILLIVLFGPPLGALLYHGARRSLLRASAVRGKQQRGMLECF